MFPSYDHAYTNKNKKWFKYSLGVIDSSITLKKSGVNKLKLLQKKEDNIFFSFSIKMSNQ